MHWRQIPRYLDVVKISINDQQRPLESFGGKSFPELSDVTILEGIYPYFAELMLLVERCKPLLRDCFQFDCLAEVKYFLSFTSVMVQQVHKLTIIGKDLSASCFLSNVTNVS